MSLGSIDQQIAFALEAFHREHLDEETLANALRVCLESGQSVDDYLLQSRAITRGNVESIVDFLQEQELGEEAWDSVPDALFGQLKNTLDRVGSGSELPGSRTPHGRSNAATSNAPDSNSPDSNAPGSSTSESKSANEVARFDILQSHARGGLGEVFVAHDRQLQRRVAIKQIRERWLESIEYRERFLREAEITARLEHPGVVPVYAMGENSDGNPYYAMRLVRGDSLQVAIEAFHQEFVQPGGLDARLKLRQLLGQFVDVCNTIGYAHSRGIIHRDIKPANIMLGKYGETLVVDWGLAKFAGADERRLDSESMIDLGSGSGSAPTRLGSAVGTPQYMSPEQASGAVHRIAPASDVYCLGATLYHLLTGRPPHDAPANEVLEQIRHGTFRRPRETTSIPPALESICLKAMALHRHERYPSANELKEDVERWLGDERVLAHEDSSLERVGRWSRRHRTGLVALAVATVLLSLGAAAGTYYWSHDAQRNLELKQQRETRIAATEATANSLYATSLRAMKEGNYETAASALGQACDALMSEPELSERLTLSRQALQVAESLSNYEAASILGQESMGTEQDALSYGTLRNALTALGVFQHGDWWNHLPAEYMSAAELDRLRDRIYSDLLMMNVLRMKLLLYTLAKEQVSNPVSAIASFAMSGKPFRSPLVVQEVDGCLEFIEFVQGYRSAASLVWSRDFLNDLKAGKTVELDAHGIEYANSTDAMLIGLFGAAEQHTDLIGRVIRSPIREDPDMVDEAFQAACLLDPNNYVLHAMYAAVRFSDGDYGGAQDTASQAIAIRPEAHWAYLIRSKSLYFESRFVEKTKLSDAIKDRQKKQLLQLSIQDSNRALLLAPHDPLSHLFHGNAIYELRGVEDAAANWIRYFELARDANLLANLSLLRFDSTELRRKHAIANSRFKRGQRGPGIVGLLAICRFEKRDYAKAIGACDELLRVHPNDAFGFAVRGAARLRLGEEDLAESDLQRAMELDPERFFAQQHHAILLESRQAWEAAAARWEAASRCAQNQLQRTAADFGKCRALIELDRINEVKSVVMAGIERHPDADWQRIARRSDQLADMTAEMLGAWTQHPTINSTIKRLPLFNGGFELGFEKHWANARGKPLWWNRAGCRSRATIASDQQHTALKIEHQSPRQEGSFATTEQTIPCLPGKHRYRIQCQARGENVSKQAISIVVNANWENPVLEMRSGSWDWTELSAEFEHAANDDSQTMNISIVSQAPGIVWLDDLSIDVVN